MSSIPFDPWQFLRDVTTARIALGRCGGSLPTRAWLEFRLAHARARDAVHVPFDSEQLRSALQSAGIDAVTVHSAASTREQFLLRPDLGRQLDQPSREQLRDLNICACDLVLIISDGLSSPAAQSHALSVAVPLIEQLKTDSWQIAPVVIVPHGRVAIEDEIGELWGAKLALILLGERPGLGSPDSLGAYFVYEPRVGRTDAERNCVSNIRPGGLPPEFAVDTLQHLLTSARIRRISGVALKDERGALPNLRQT